MTELTNLQREALTEQWPFANVGQVSNLPAAVISQHRRRDIWWMERPDDSKAKQEDVGYEDKK